jgi:hypothetical protein
VSTLFALALEDLRAAAAARGKEIPVQIFERYDLDPEDGVSYTSLAAHFGVPVTTVTNHLAWARREFRRMLLERLREAAGEESDAEVLLGSRLR